MLGAAAMVSATAAWSCGFENPDSIAMQRGMMNLAFPKSAWVRTAIWQAQVAGELPPVRPMQRDDLSTQGRGTLQLMRASWLVKALAARLGSKMADEDLPGVAVVLLGPMLWSRLEPGASGVLAQVHVQGPASGDVVLVTDTPALEAIIDAGMRFEQAIELGLVRFYGSPERVAVVQAWFAST